ncbi:hypothetical protein DEU56DRAFT_468663 [Suillus clintonianus]|uniref:uncharacterized protein n=1 Tax=Suillus clintonianus TaxID=1904413 RepID=UPI001B87D127|nr:uncharacterized protein DEU56DRAFT_468663 [Suillus clintonianus]KAG2130383.1 hypothetical protein DEU56DRAFT_468663 [Suillus clintonianus]
MTSTVTAIASLLPTTTGQLNTQPPIAQIIPILRSTFGLLRAFLSQAPRVLVALATPLLIFVPLISRLLSPVILVFHIILDATVYTPYAIISNVAAALYPLYVFCGIACISGAVLGILGRSLVTLSNNLIAPELPKATQSLQGLSMRSRKRRRKSSFTEDS